MGINLNNRYSDSRSQWRRRLRYCRITTCFATSLACISCNAPSTTTQTPESKTESVEQTSQNTGSEQTTEFTPKRHYPKTGCEASKLPGFCHQNLGSEERVYGIIVSDFDNDQTPDVFAHGHDRFDEIILMSNTPTHSSGLATPFDRHSCSAADVDLDDDLDIYCAYGVDRGESVFGNLLFINDDAGNFSQQTPSGAEDPYGRGRKAVFFNYNGDTYPDLLVTNWEGRSDDKPNVTRI